MKKLKLNYIYVWISQIYMSFDFLQNRLEPLDNNFKIPRANEYVFYNKIFVAGKPSTCIKKRMEEVLMTSLHTFT